MIYFLRSLGMMVGDPSHRNEKGKKYEPTSGVQQRSLETKLVIPSRPHLCASIQHFLINTKQFTLARKENFLLRCSPTQSIFSGFFQDLRVSRKILTSDKRIGTAIGKKSGM